MRLGVRSKPDNQVEFWTIDSLWEMKSLRSVSCQILNFKGRLSQTNHALRVHLPIRSPHGYRLPLESQTLTLEWHW